MKKENRLTAVLPGTIIAVVTFVLFFISTKYILETPLELKNIIVFIVFSKVIGTISFALYLLKPKIAFSLFLAGLIAGFAYMIYTYSRNLDGWGDLIGLLTFFMFTLIGLGGGLIIQLIVYLVGRNKKLNADKNNTKEHLKSLDLNTNDK